MANDACPVASQAVSWVLWLAVPVVVTLVAAAITWLRGRPARELTTRQAMRAHDDYLDALTQSPRSKDRGPFALPRTEPPD
jgi:cytochrome c-type biogenesis protein CcmH/NrfF